MTELAPAGISSFAEQIIIWVTGYTSRAEESKMQDKVRHLNASAVAKHYLKL